MVQHEETATESSVVKKIQRQPQKVPNSPEFVDTESDDSDNYDKEQEPAEKIMQKLTKKAPKSPKPADTDQNTQTLRRREKNL